MKKAREWKGKGERERLDGGGEKGERNESKDIYSFKENSNKNDTEETGWNINGK